MSPATHTAPPRPGDTYVQSFARGLQVIRSFSAQAPEQTLSEVAERAGLTRAGARRILLTLQTLGYVEFDGKWFRLTPRILELGFSYLSSMPIWDLAEPVVKDLVDRVHESSSTRFGRSRRKTPRSSEWANGSQTRSSTRPMRASAKAAAPTRHARSKPRAN